MHILSPVTDDCRSWISGKRNESIWPDRVSNPGPLALEYSKGLVRPLVYRQFSYLRDRICSILVVLENSVLPMGWDSPHAKLKKTSLFTNVYKRNTTIDVRILPSYNVTVNILSKASIFPIICKKNKQSSVFYPDQEIPTLGSTDNAGNEMHLVLALSVYPRIGISRFASETNDRFYLSISICRHFCLRNSSFLTF